MKITKIHWLHGLKPLDFSDVWHAWYRQLGRYGWTYAMTSGSESEIRLAITKNDILLEYQI